MNETNPEQLGPDAATPGPADKQDTEGMIWALQRLIAIASQNPFRP